MNVKRVSTIAVLGALATWLAAAATSGNRESVEPIVARTPLIDTRGTALASEIARLHDHLRSSVAPRQPSRNLFSFSTRQAGRPLQPPVARPSPTDAIPARPAAPVLKLSGIAENATAGGGVVRTAIISAFGELFLVKEGEKVTERFRVVKISSEVVELSDLTDSTALRLALK